MGRFGKEYIFIPAMPVPVPFNEGHRGRPRHRRGVAANLRLAEGIVAATKSILVRVDAVCARIESADRRSADLISMSMPFPLLNSTAARQSSVAAASCMLPPHPSLDRHALSLVPCERGTDGRRIGVQA